MASTTKKTTKVTLNTQEARNDLKAFQEELKNSRAEYTRLCAEAEKTSEALAGMNKTLDQLEKQGKKDTAEYKNLEAEFIALSKTSKELKTSMGQTLGDIKATANAIKTLDDQLSTCDVVIKDLANSSQRQLSRSLKEVNRHVRDMSQNSEGLEDAHTRAEKLNRQLKITKGEFVDVSKGMADLSNQSDRWVSKAIRSQADLVASLKKTDSSYNAELATLRQLEAEEDRRKGKMDLAQASVAATNPKATASDLRRAKATLTEARDNTDLSDTKQLKTYNDYLATIEERLKAVNGTAKMTAAEMKKIWSNPKGASRNDINTVLEELNQRLNKIPVGSKNFERLSAKIKELQEVAKGVKKDLVDVNDVIRRSKTGEASIEELKKAYKQLEDELSHIKDLNGSAFKNGQKDLKQLKKQIDEVTGAANKQASSWKTAYHNLVAYAGLFTLFNTVKSMISSVISKSFEMSDAITNIRKVSGLAEQDVEKMVKTLSKMDVRTSLAELNEIAYAGAKLGVGTRGVEALEGFVNAANQVNMALKEDMSGDALTALAKITEVMGEIDAHGVEQAMLKTGSAIFKLGATSTATADHMVDFTARLAAVAKTSGVTTDQLLGLSSASDSMFLAPEVSATAFIKALSSIKTNVDAIEKAIHVDPGTLRNLVESGQGMDAMVLALEKIKGLNATEQSQAFKELGSEGARMNLVFTTMSDNVNMLRAHLRTAEKAFRDGTAVTDEFNLQQETAQALMERANNMWKNTFINPDGVDMVKELAKAWYDLTKTLTESSTWMGNIKFIMESVLFLFTTLAKILPQVVYGLTIFKVVQQWQKLSAAVQLAGGWMQFFRMKTDEANLANKKLNATMKASLWGLLGSIIATVIVKLTDLIFKEEEVVKQSSKVDDAIHNIGKELSKTNAEVDQHRDKIQKMLDKIHDENTANTERIKLVGKVKELWGEYNGVLDAQGKFIRDNSVELDKYIAKLRQKKVAELADDKLAKAMLDQQVAKNEKERLAKERKEKQAEAKKQREKEVQQAKDQHAQDTRTNAGIGGPQSKAMQSGDNALLNSRIKKAEEREKHATDAIDEMIRENDEAAKVADAEFDQWKKIYEGAMAAAKGIDLGDGDGSGSGSGSGGGDPLRKEEKMAKERSNALLANIQAYYEEQARKFYEWVGEMNKNGEKVSEGYIKEFMDNLTESRLNAEGLARQSIATAGKEWDEFKGQLTKDQFQTATETDKRLLAAIEQSDVKELHDLFEKLGANLSKENNKTLSENLGALLDEIFKNGAKNLREAAERLVKRQQEIQKILNEHDYTGTVDRNTRSKFDELRFLRPAQGVNKDTAEGQEKMAQAFDKLTKKARESVATLYAIDPAAENFEAQMQKFLSVAGDGFDFTQIKGQDLKALYIELIKYTDSYTEAQKRQYDRAKKIADQMWEVNKRNLANQKALRDMQNEANLFGKRTNFASNLGLADLTADPEVELMKLKMQMAEDYYAFVKKNSQNQQLIDEADKARQEAQLAYVNQMATAMKERLSLMKDLVGPIETFGAQIGEALGQMTDDAESASEAIKGALKSMVKSWGDMLLNDVKTQLWKGINDAGAKSAAKNAQPDIEAAQQNADAEIGVVSEELGASAARPMYVWLVNGQTVDAKGNPVSTEGKENVQTLSGAPGDMSGAKSPASGIAADTGSAIGEGVADVVTGGSVKDAAAGIVGNVGSSLLGATFGGGKDKSSKQRKAELKEARKHEKEMQKVKRDSMKAQSKETEKGMSDMVDTTQEGNDEQTGITQVAEDVKGKVIDTAMTANLGKQKEANQEAVENDAESTRARVTLSIAGAIGKCFEFLGPIAGPIMAGVVMATLQGLLQWALSSAFGGSSKNNNNNAPKTNTKLVSGMLTYDSGNVRDLKPFFDKDGNMYWATEDDDRNHDGINLLTKPTATTINGAPSLVAEQGPELVIGRETTQAMMQNNPALLKALYQYDKHHSGRTAYDTGNLAPVLGSSAAESLGAVAPGASAVTIQRDPEMLALMSALLTRLNEPIQASINMYGRDGLYEQHKRASAFMKGKN